MIILIDNGHGYDTAGKCSPDKRLLEYKYAREIAIAVESRLKADGYDVRRIVPEGNDISLTTRCQRVNNLCKQHGEKNVLLVSIHCNAAPPNDGKWHAARGWSAWTSRGQTRGDLLADCLYKAAERHLKGYADTFTEKDIKGKQRPIRTDYSDGDPDWEAGFAVLAKTNCAACLTENLFQDNRDDVDYLLSDEGREHIVQIHVDGIVNYIKKQA